MSGECDDESSQLGFQNQAEMNTMSMTVASVYRSGCEPMVSLSQSASFGGFLQENLVQGSNSSPSQRENYPFGLKFDEILPKISMFESGSIPEFVVPYGSPGLKDHPHQNYPSNKRSMDESLSANVVEDDNGCQVAEGNGKRKRNLKLSPSHEVAEKDQHDHSGETFGKKEDDDQKNEINEVANSSGTRTSKHQENHQAEEGPKQNYVHVRAKRGQATNSHSLAERVRREKISERMRLLQELVPGCNKITGKAVMLDEIINYVQSLQQQVEFLSMKLAAVSPDDLSFDNNQVLSKDILHLRGNDSSFIGFNQAMSSFHGLNHGIYQGNLTTMPNAAAQYHHFSQAAWDGDMQNFLHMGFDLSPAVSNFGQNGLSKTEQL